MSNTQIIQSEKVQKLYDYILSLPGDELQAISGKPEKVLEEIDRYSEKVQFMHIGKSKGNVIVDKIRETKPKVFLELGCYFGYSAILFGKELLNDPEAKYYSFEANPFFADISKKLVALAGLSTKVDIFVGEAGKLLPEFNANIREKRGKNTTADFIFIDHWKELYVPDLRVLESLDLVKSGTVIVADNIVRPGAPEYVKYVQSSLEEKKKYIGEVVNPSGKDLPGKWNLIYDSKTVDVPGTGDAIEVTKCLGQQ